MKPYPKYKDSGIEWLGKVPEGWGVKKLGYHAGMIVPMRDKPTVFDGDIPWIRIEDFDGKYISDSKSEQRVSMKIIREMNLKVYPVGTVLCSCSCNMGATAIVSRPLTSNQTFIGIVPKSNISSEFLYYLMNANSERLQYLGSGAIQQYLSKENFKNLRLAFPPLQDQTTIASFLDQKTDKIDELIKKNEKLIELLKEKRQAVISHAVTKGLDPKAKMKDSGIEWIGEIPEGWDTFPIKQIVKNKIVKGVGKNLPLLSLEHIVSGEGRLVDEYMPEIVSADEHATFETGDILFGKLRPYLKKYYRVNFNGCCPTELMVFSPNKNMLEKDYLFYLIQSNYFVSLADATSYGVKMPRTSWEAISSYYILIPKISEQHSIVEFLDNISEKISVTIQKIQSQIAALKEYRQALISNVVTGKVSVTG